MMGTDFLFCSSPWSLLLFLCKPRHVQVTAQPTEAEGSSQAVGCVLDGRSLLCRGLMRQFTKSSPPMGTEPVGVPCTGNWSQDGSWEGSGQICLTLLICPMHQSFLACMGEAGGMLHSSLWRPNGVRALGMPTLPASPQRGWTPLLLVIKCCWLSVTRPRPCVLCQLGTSLFSLC